MRLLLGLPALLALLALFAYGVFLYGWKSAHAEARAYTMANQALAGQDYERARIGYQALLQLSGRDRQEYAFRLMLCLAQLGQERAAARLALMLAPPNRTGYAPAHLYVARSLLVATNSNRTMVEAAINHLERVLTVEPSNRAAHDLLSQLYLLTGRPEAAKRHLLELVSTSGEAMIRLAVVLASEGDTDGTRHWAERAARFFRSKLDQAKADSYTDRIAWANALLLQDDYPGAFDALVKGQKQFGNPAYIPEMAKVCANWGQNLARNSPTNVAERLRIAQQGLALDSQNQTLLLQLAALTAFKGPAADQASDLIKQMLAEGQNAGLLHFCLGGLAVQAGDMAKANEHFRLAYEISPNMPDVANNMALALAMQPKPDLERALNIMNSVIQRAGGNPAFRETRGEILVKMGKYEEALRDLAYALPLLGDTAATHRAMAECYRHLGMNDLAEEHEKAIKGLPAGLPTSIPAPTNSPPASTNAPKNP